MHLRRAGGARTPPGAAGRPRRPQRERRLHPVHYRRARHPGRSVAAHGPQRTAGREPACPHRHSGGRVHLAHGPEAEGVAMSAGAFVQLVAAQAAILRRNVTYWLISILIAVLSMAVFGWLFQPDSQAFDLAFVDGDGTEATRALAEAFATVENVEVREESREEALSALEGGDRAAVVVAPKGFEEQLRQGSASLLVYY